MQRTFGRPLAVAAFLGLVLVSASSTALAQYSLTNLTPTRTAWQNIPTHCWSTPGGWPTHPELHSGSAMKAMVGPLSTTAQETRSRSK